METIERPTLQTKWARERISAGLSSIATPLVALQGPCAPELKSFNQILLESQTHGMIGRTLSGLVTVQCLPMSKPRSDPKNWSGEDSTNPELAVEMIRLASQHAAIGMEILRQEQINRYVTHLALVWTGARSEPDFDLKLRLASEHQDLPLSIKCGLSGEIDLALEHIERLRAERNAGAGTIVLCYRGGENAKTPEAWEAQYIRALGLTGGQMIVDVAHGSEMAHDPDQNFQKSVLGQLACLDHVIGLAKDGYVPAGVKIEASNAPSSIDPVIPLQKSFDAIQRLRLAVEI